VDFLENSMRRIILFTALSLQALTADAREAATEIVVAGGAAQIFKSTVTGSDAKSFVITSDAARAVTLKFDASNDICGVEMQTTGQHDYAKYGQFPITVPLAAMINNSYKVSFFLTRSAWIGKQHCEFTLSVQ
jgi:hypothetical protein